jgi:MFS family permease
VKLKPHATILTTFACFGAIIGVHVGAMPVLIANSGISLEAYGIVATIGMLVNISCMMLGGLLSRYTSHRTVLLVGFPVLFLAMGYALLVNSVFTFALSFVLTALAFGTIDLFMNAEASVVEQQEARPVFNMYHGAVSFSIAAFAILGSLVAVLLQPWFALLALLPFVAVTWAAIYKSIPPHVSRPDDPATSSVKLPRRILTVIGLAAGLNVTCEAASILWAGQLLATIAPELSAISGLGVAFYGLCGGTMRFMGDGLRARFGEVRLLSISIFVAIAGFAVLGLAPGFWISVFAFTAVGFGLAVTFPCLFSLTGQLVPHNRAAAMGFMATIGGAPRIVLPWILGLLAASYGVSAVFAACAVVSFTALLLIVFSLGQLQTKGASAS